MGRAERCGGSPMQDRLRFSRTPVTMRLSTRIIVPLLCASFFGICLTAYVILTPGHPYAMQILASAIKVPVVLLTSCVMSTIALWCIVRILLRELSAADILPSAIQCLFVNGMTIGALGPLLAAIASQGNYSATIFAAYGAFAFGGAAGCVGFYRKLGATHYKSRRWSRLWVSAIWTVLFALIGAQLGWSLRPIVGWTGETFVWFRGGDASIWDQMRCEGRNLQHGGIRFPSKDQPSDPKQWPCGLVDGCPC
jgi:hypothetical protein